MKSLKLITHPHSVSSAPPAESSVDYCLLLITTHRAMQQSSIFLPCMSVMEYVLFSTGSCPYTSGTKVSSAVCLIYFDNETQL